MINTSTKEYNVLHAIEQMIERYHCKTNDDYKNALKEIIQEIALLGLAKTNFFDIAAFYGGTALRIFYGLDRFSEDLDFSLLMENSAFDIEKYTKAIENELNAFGFEVTVTAKNKTGKTAIESAFIKTDTLIHMLKINAVTPPVSGIHANERLKVKLEIDTAPPPGAEYEVKYSLNPIPYSIRLFSPESLFAGKLHAVLCRRWKSRRVKGRDFYDFIWFISKSIPVRLEHLEKRMNQTGHLKAGIPLTGQMLKIMLQDRFSSVSIEHAKADVLPFIRDPFALNVWSSDFFCVLAEQLIFV